MSAPEQRGDVRVERMSGDGVVEVLTVTLSLREAEVDGPLRSSRKVMDHGILRTYWHAAPQAETIELGLISATVLATQRCAQIIGTMVEGLRRILVGRVSVKQIGGPVMLYDIAAEVSKTKDTFWHWFSLWSLNLGIMNLLPVPVLDGGLILLSGIEILRRRRLTVALREGELHRVVLGACADAHSGRQRRHEGLRLMLPDGADPCVDRHRDLRKEIDASAEHR